MTFFASFDPWCELFAQRFLLVVLSFQRGDFHPLLGDDELKGKSRDLVTAIHDEGAGLTLCQFS
jgi:hypothetical protein